MKSRTFLLVLAVLCVLTAQALGNEITKKDVPLYVGSTDGIWSEDIPLYFVDGVEDLPYMDVNDCAGLLVGLYHDWAGETEYGLSIRTEENKVTLTRENGVYAHLDFDNKKITFIDYNDFIRGPKNSLLGDLLSTPIFNADGDPQLFRSIPGASYSRNGDIMELDLASYKIDMIAQDGLYLVPLQTIGDFFMADPLQIAPFYNGKVLILANGRRLGRTPEELTDLGELYYSAEPKARSKELTEYGYWELCMALDHLYGMRDTHEISSFSQIFWQIAFDERFLDPDPYEADTALYDFIDFHMNDLHSEFLGFSYLTGVEDPGTDFGSASRSFFSHVDRYSAAREKFYPDGYLDYEEVGNTAYITFDEFDMIGGGPEYYAALEGEKLPNDTLGLIIYAHDKITRDNSPIENVVLDLSNNTGGDVDAAMFVLGWFLGEAPFSSKDAFTGAVATAVYQADVNLDREFNEKDTVEDKNLYCLISPVSFSCGNLVPSVFKASQRVTLIGRTSGGGACTVLPMSTAWGTPFQISGPHKMAFLKNGSFYDVDRGVEPDFYIDRLEHFYDREALTKIINGYY